MALRFFVGALIATFMVGNVPRSHAGAPLDQKSAQFFESRVRPVLATHCYQCHSEGVKIRGGLRVDYRDGLIHGGARGPAIVPGAPEKSRLLDAVRYIGDLKMPPKGRLKDADLAALIEWVKMGAPWPNPSPLLPSPASGRGDGGEGVKRAAQTGTYTFTEEQKKYWAFQPVRAPKFPSVKNTKWAQSPLDLFVLAKLEAKGFHPAPPADKLALIRRATFDLIGLPPAPAEIEAFVNDRSPAAFKKVVDRLLASPRYGERWARHWLDGVRYADSNGQDENTCHANAFRYRDYVIDAFNDDLPYDQFVREQLAGDLLPREADTQINHRRLIATGFLVLGPKFLAEPDKVKMAIDIIDEQMDVTTRVFMGITFTCARCHDHKFDPIPQRDYYALAGIFKSTKTMATYATVAHWHERPLAPQEEADKALAHQQAVAKKKDELQKLRNDEKAGPGVAKKLREELAELEKNAPRQIDYCMAVTEDKVVEVPVHIRGDHNKLGAVEPRHFPQILCGDRQPPLPENSSGRLEFANWLASPSHPLTARVMVNRIWQGHFGRGLVGSSDNFGKLGERPTHPELLDWLAKQFVDRGWSVKELQRAIMLSATYAQASRIEDGRSKMATAGPGHDPQSSILDPQSQDPDNRLLWRHNRQRLDAEQLHDAVLFVSGRLENVMGGTLLTTPVFGYVTNDQSGNAGRYDVPRRSIYLPVVRNALYDLFQVFDFVDPSVVNTYRSETTVAPQALFMMNNHLIVESAKELAKSLLADPKLADAARVQTAFGRIFGRPAKPAEVARALEFVKDYVATATKANLSAVAARAQAWQTYCQTLLCANEFIYLD